MRHIEPDFKPFPASETLPSPSEDIQALKTWLSLDTSVQKHEFEIFDENFKLKLEYFIEGQDQNAFAEDIKWLRFYIETCFELNTGYAHQCREVDVRAAMILMDTRFSRLDTEDTENQYSLHEYLIVCGVNSAESPVERFKKPVWTYPIWAYLEAIGPFIFSKKLFSDAPAYEALKGKDPLFAACALSDTHTIRLLLSFYVHQLQKFRDLCDAFAYDKASESYKQVAEAHDRFNQGIDDAFKYIVRSKDAAEKKEIFGNLNVDNKIDKAIETHCMHYDKTFNAQGASASVVSLKGSQKQDSGISSSAVALLPLIDAQHNNIETIRGQITTFVANPKTMVINVAGSEVYPRFTLFNKDFEFRKVFFLSDNTKVLDHEIKLLNVCFNHIDNWRVIQIEDTLKREEKIALLLLDMDDIFYLEQGKDIVQCSVFEYAVHKGFGSAIKSTGVAAASFAKYIDALGPYFFHKQPMLAEFQGTDYLLKACQLGNTELVRILLRHYAKNVGKYNALSSGARHEPSVIKMSEVAARRFNDGIVNAIKYVTDPKYNAHHDLLSIFGEPGVKNVRIYSIENKSAENQKGCFSIEEHFKLYSSKASANASHPSQPINPTDNNVVRHPVVSDKPYTPAGMSLARRWALGMGIIAAVGLAVIEGVTWNSDLLNELFEKFAGVEEGETLTGRDKGGILAFSSFTAGVVTGAATWAIMGCFGKQKLTSVSFKGA